MLLLCIIGETKSPGVLTLDPRRWYVDTYVVDFLMLLQVGICAAGTADYLYVRKDLQIRLGASTLGIVERAMASRDAGDLSRAHELADELIKRLPSWPWSYTFRGHLRAAMERREQALQDFDQALKLKSDDALARLARAEHKLSAGDPAGALDDLDALPHERQSENAILKLRGSALYRLGRRAEAIIVFDKVVRSSPTDADARVSRGEALAASNHRATDHGNASIAALEMYVIEEGERVALSTLSAAGTDSLSREDVETAIQDFTFALDQAPDDRRLRRLRADAYYRKGDFDAGDADYRVAMENADPKQLAVALRQRGLARRRSGDGSGALRDFNASIDTYPTALAHFYRGLYYEEIGRADYALADLDAAVDMAPEDDDFLSHRAALLAATGDFDGSGAAFRDVEARFPANSHNYAVWLGTLVRRGNLLDALALSGRAIAACPDDPHLRLTAARIRAENGQVDNALHQVEEAVRLGVSPAQASHTTAQVLAMAGRLAEAEVGVSAVADEPSPDQRFALLTRHKIRREMGNLTGALADLDQVIALDPESVGVLVERACLLLAIDGASPEALADIEKALEINPASAFAINHLAQWRAANGDTAKAIEAAERAISAAQGDGYGKRTLGLTYFQARRWDDAVDVLAEVVRATPKDKRALWTLGAAYANGGRSAEAEATFSALVQLDRGDLQARAGLAVTVSQQGRSDEAIAQFTQLREEFGHEASDWMENRLSADVLPHYAMVMADWRASEE
jgi:tetratricopeptide (TPR) repeat protein